MNSDSLIENVESERNRNGMLSLPVAISLFLPRVAAASTRVRHRPKSVGVAVGFTRAGAYAGTRRDGCDMPLTFRFIHKCDGVVPTYLRRGANVARVQVKQLFINIVKRRY